MCIVVFSNAQIKSPDLRCLKVNTNGDLTLSWLAPADPGAQFNSYLIYTSTFKSGPFIPVDSIYSYSTTTYTHVGAGANVQTKYYYMRTRYNSGGLKESIINDTLQSIWLNLISFGGAKALSIQFTPIHQPKLITSGSYTISKEYPLGTWSTLNVTNLNNYADTISICTASINYRVNLSDQSGCISESNISGGIFNDTKSPEEPIIDSISVLANGNTVLAWKIPIDKDIVKYEIQVRTAVGTNSVLDNVNGRNNTVYTYSSSAATLTNTSIFVGAIDSCKRGSTLNYSLTTMFLNTKYATCDYKTELNWNPYLSMPGKLKEYQIFYSENGGAYIKLASTTLTAFTHSNVSAGKNLSYFIRAINSDKSITSSSNRVSFLAYLVKTPDYLYLPRVTVIDKSTIQIKILIDTSKEGQGIDVLRSEEGGAFKQLTFLPYTGVPIFEYNDVNVQTLNKNYFYKVQLRDSCGNPRTMSNTCKTILLKVEDNADQIFTKRLSWNDYEGFAGGVRFYKVYRLINDVREASPLSTLNPSITTFNDNVELISNQGSKIEYLIEAIENGSQNQYGISEVSFSNLAGVYMEESIFIPSALAPNGVNTKWLPITNYIDKTEYLIRIFDRWGKQIFQTNSDAEAWDGGDFPMGVYVYIISFKNARGEYKEAKGKLQLMR
jgi:gliding motility-associated-like protein